MRRDPKIGAGTPGFRNGTCAGPSLALILLVGLLSACAAGSRSGGAAGRVPASPLEGLQVELGSDRALYEPYQPVRLALTLRNPSSRPVDLSFPTAQRYDFLIRDAEGTVRWRWSDNRSFAQVESIERIAPGDSLRWTGTFEGVLSAGTYTAEGLVMPLQGEARSSMELQVR